MFHDPKFKRYVAPTLLAVPDTSDQDGADAFVGVRAGGTYGVEVITFDS